MVPLARLRVAIPSAPTSTVDPKTRRCRSTRSSTLQLTSPAQNPHLIVMVLRPRHTIGNAINSSIANAGSRNEQIECRSEARESTPTRVEARDSLWPAGDNAARRRRVLPGAAYRNDWWRNGLVRRCGQRATSQRGCTIAADKPPTGTVPLQGGSHTHRYGDPRVTT